MCDNCKNGAHKANQRFGVALYGMGRSGSIHIKNLFSMPKVDILYIVEEDTDKATAFLAEWGLVESTKVVRPEDDDEMLKNPSVSCVFVCSPTYTHCAITLRACRNKKHVFCEKPISQSIEEVYECYNEAEKNGITLFCSFNRRYDPSLREVYDRVKEGELGQLYMAKMCSRDNPVPPIEYLKISGGFFHDCAVHDIDIVCWIIGEYPESVFVKGHAFTEEIKALDDVDTCIITLSFPCKVMVVIDLSRMGTYGYHQTLEVFGEKGAIVSENQRPTEVQRFLKNHTLQKPIKYSFQQRYKCSYYAAMEGFFNIISGKEKIMITKETVVNTSLIANACEKSLRSGKQETITYQNSEMK